MMWDALRAPVRQNRLLRRMATVSRGVAVAAPDGTIVRKSEKIDTSQSHGREGVACAPMPRASLQTTNRVAPLR